MNLQILNLVLFLSFLLSCSETHISSISSDINHDGKPDRLMHTLKKFGNSILVETDNDLDGNVDNLLWVNGKSDNIQSSMILYDESYKNGKVVRQTWYGPGNLKLLEKSDENEDGYMEAVAYFNKNAKPGILKGITARIEVDSFRKGKPDLWIYPGLRIESDKNGDEIPECIIKWQDIAEADLSGSDRWEKIRSKNCLPLANEESLKLHPERINREMNQATIPITLNHLPNSN